MSVSQTSFTSLCLPVGSGGPGVAAGVQGAARWIIIFLKDFCPPPPASWPTGKMASHAEHSGDITWVVRIAHPASGICVEGKDGVSSFPGNQFSEKDVHDWWSRSHPVNSAGRNVGALFPSKFESWCAQGAGYSWPYTFAGFRWG